MSFFQWFDSVKEEAESTDCGKAFLSLGFVVHATGGTLTAWRKKIGTREYLVSCDDTAIPSDSPWVVGWYVSDTGEPIHESEYPDWQSALEIIRANLES